MYLHIDNTAFLDLFIAPDFVNVKNLNISIGELFDIIMSASFIILNNSSLYFCTVTLSFLSFELTNCLTSVDLSNSDAVFVISFKFAAITKSSLLFAIKLSVHVNGLSFN